MLQNLNLNIPLSQLPQSSKPKAFKYIMIHDTLQNSFNPEQWRQISGLSSNKIYESLIGSQELFNRYFSIFYTNHVRLYHWYLLAREKHYIIRPYINQKLLRKTQDNHRDDMKYLQIKLAKERERQKQRQQKNKLQLPAQQLKNRKYKIDELSNEIFNFMSSKSKTASLLVWQKPWSFKKHTKDSNSAHEHNDLEATTSMTARKDKRKKLPVNQQLLKKIDFNSNNHDFHELYIQTFHACDGPRYIFYDYEKHMKGINQMDKYNTFIRGSSKGKAIDLRLTQNSQQEPIFKEMKSWTIDRMRSSYQYSPVGKATQENFKKRSKAVFRRTKSKNVGKFIRK